MPLSPFALCIIAMVLLGALGLPIGHSMIAASILYLLLAGLDLGTAAEQILNGLFNSYVLLAIPLFILAADLMNIGSLTDRLLQFCLVLVGRFRGGLGHVNVVANMIFAGMSGSAIADAGRIRRIILRLIAQGGAAAAFYALFASTVLYRAVTWKQLYEAILSSGKASTSVGMLIAGALAFNYVVTVENIPNSLARFMAAYDFSAGGFLLLANIILLILGCLLEGSTILLVVVPIFIPTAKVLGVDLVHFGVVVVVNIMIGLLTPPYGLLLFVLASMTKQPLWAIVKEAAPFIIAAILVLALITAVPGSILWLPRLMGYKG